MRESQSVDAPARGQVEYAVDTALLVAAGLDYGLTRLAGATGHAAFDQAMVKFQV